MKKLISLLLVFCLLMSFTACTIVMPDKNSDGDDDKVATTAPTKSDPADSTDPTDPTDPPCEHEYQSTFTEPTCTEFGQLYAECSVCGDHQSISVAPTGHNYVSGICNRCGDKNADFDETTDPSKDHCNHVFDGKTLTAQSCTEPGYLSVVCTLCDTEYSITFAPSGHQFTDATCTEAKTCSRCGLTEGEALGHSWVDATTETPKTCTACGATEGEPLVSEGPDDPSDSSISIPCTGIEVTASVSLLEKGSSVVLTFSVEPIDTTDTIRFASSNTDVATVDATGRVTAVGNGEATITITCGSIVKTCKVTCDVDDTPDEPVEPEKYYYLKLNGITPNYPTGENSCETSFKTGNSFTLKIVDEDGVAVEVVWTASKPENVVITGNTIKLYKPGSVTISATHNGVTYSCLVRVTGDPIDIPADNPVTPEATYLLRLNGAKPYYHIGQFGCEATFKVGNYFRLNLVNDLEAKVEVTWTASKEGYVTIEGDKITCIQEGIITLTAEIDGQTYTCRMYIHG